MSAKHELPEGMRGDDGFGAEDEHPAASPDNPAIISATLPFGQQSGCHLLNVVAAPPGLVVLPETSELARLHALKLLEHGWSAPELLDPELDALVRTAAAVCGTPISLVSMVGEDRQWFKANFGLVGTDGTPRDVSFCAHAIQGPDVLVVPDATSDSRFASNALVTGAPFINFYAGAPLTLSGGERVGALCVIDTTPRTLSPAQITILSDLAKVAVTLLESKRDARKSRLIAAELRGLNEFAPLGIFSTDADGGCTHVNGKWQEIFGLTFDQAKGDGWAKAIHHDDSARVFRCWSEAVERKTIFDEEFRILRPDASVRHVRSISRGITDPHGNVAGYVGSVEDITDRRDIETRLASKRMKFDLIIKATKSAALEWNVQTGETKFDENWARMTGQTLSDFDNASAATWFAQIHPDDHARLSKAHEEHFANPAEPFVVTIRKKHVDGHWVWLMNRGQIATFTASGAPEWVYLVQLDVTESVQREEAQRQSALLLEKTGEVAGIGGWDIDLRTNALRWTNQTCRIHGVPPGFQPDVATAIDFYAPTSRPLIQAALEAAIATGQSWDLELQLIRGDGQLIWVRAAGSVEYEGAVPVRLYGGFQDISERILTQAALRTQHRRLALATENGKIGVYDINLVTGEAVVSDSWRSLLRFDPHVDIDSQAEFLTRVFPEDMPMVLAADAATISGQTERTVSEFRFRAGDGSTLWLRSDGYVTERAADGTALRLLGTMVDITSAKLDSDALNASEEKFRSAIENAPVGTALVDSAGLIVTANEAVCRFLGLERSDFLGRAFRYLFQLAEPDWEKVLHPATTGQPLLIHQGERSFVHADGHQVWGLLSISRTSSAMDRPSHVIVQIMDITDRKQIERMKQDFVATISHELRTPLTSIRGALGLVTGAMSQGISDTAMELLRIANRNCDNLSVLVNDFLDIEKMASNSFSYDLRNEHVGALVIQALETNQAYADQFKVRLALTPYDGDPVARVDKTRLQQVLSNLLSNAAKFSPANERVTISIVTNGSTLRISIADNGPGIPLSFQARMFQRFAQEDTSATRQKGGTGLGLHIARQMMEGMNGSLGFDSTVGKGSTFWVELSLAASVTDSAPPRT